MPTDTKRLELSRLTLLSAILRASFPRLGLQPTWVFASFAVMLSLLSSTVAANSRSQPGFDPELRDFLKQTVNQASSFKDRYDAEVWLVAMSSRLKPFIKDPEQRLALLRAVHAEASQARLQPDLVLALIQIESAFDRFAVSRVGAQGLMQVMPFWKREIGRSSDNLMDMHTNLRYGCQILRFYLDKEKGQMSRALARYNGSLGKTWYPEKVMNAWRSRWYAGSL